MLWSIIRQLAGAGATATAGDDALSAGIACVKRGEFSVAREHLQRALAQSQEDGDAMYFLALAEARSGNLERAEELLHAARAQRDDADVNSALGNIFRLRGNLDEAAASYQRALAVDSRHLASLANLGLTLRDQGAPQQALLILDRALELEPNHVEALFNKALALTDTGASASAYELIERVLALDPEFAQAHLQRGFMLLKRREFAAGWREYAWRVRIPEIDHWQDCPYPLWQGETLDGKSVLVQAEQGLGDQIMFASCLPDLLRRARRTIVECDPRLAGLFARSFPAATVYRLRAKGKPEWSREPAADFKVRCGDLPRMLRNDDADFPRHSGYLVSDAARVAGWRARLAKLGAGLKVGLSWRGGTPGTGQAARSLALDTLLPILRVPQANFISLQYGNVNDEIADLAAGHGIELSVWPQTMADMDDMAALIANLDLVITVCTTAAHLCGALGKTAWIMVPAVAEWRYLESGSQIPWYPALRLFRQPRIDEWNEVILAIRAELQVRAAAH